MGVVHKLTPQVTNIDAVPPVPDNARGYGGRVRKYIGGPVAFAAGDDDGSTVRFIRLPSNSCLQSIKVFNDVITGATSCDFGLFYAEDKLGGVVVPSCVALFASAVDLDGAAHAATGGLEILLEATIGNFSVMLNPLWSVAGLTIDPCCQFDIVMTANTVGSGTGNILITADVIST